MEFKENTVQAVMDNVVSQSLENGSFENNNADCDEQQAQMDDMALEDGEDYEEYEDEEENVTDYAANTKGRYLTFALNGQIYGMSIATVRRIIGVPEIVQVPNCPAFARGVITLMGMHVPVVDLRLRYGMPYQEYNDRTSIVIHSIEGSSVGLVVDRVEEVATIEDEQILPPPNANGHGSNAGLVGIVKDTSPNILLLDLTKIFAPEELEWFKRRG